MPIIKLETVVNAPVERVFDLARSIDLHKDTMSKYDEKAVAGITSGLIKINETVTWEATHFGIRQNLTSKITAFERPQHFRESMVRGAFKRFDHDHFFEEINGRTLIKDVFDYDSPLGILGWIADTLFVEKHMREMLEERNEIIKRIAESDDWQQFLNETLES
jgi:ligand-binding SRPBCC domain-containing protein